MGSKFLQSEKTKGPFTDSGIHGLVEWATYKPIDVDSEPPLRSARAHRAAKRSAATTRQGIRSDADVSFEEEGRMPLLNTLIGSESGVRFDVPLGDDRTTHRAGIAL